MFSQLFTRRTEPVSVLRLGPDPELDVFHNAVRRGNLAQVRQQATPELINGRGHKDYTALHWAAQATRGHPDYPSWTLLPDQGTRAHAEETNREGGYEAMVRYLLAQGASPAAVSAYGETPLYLAAHIGRSERIVAALLEHGADPLAADQDGNTALHGAVSGQWQAVAITERLLNHGGPALLEARNQAGVTALDSITVKRDHPYREALLSCLAVYARAQQAQQLHARGLQQLANGDPDARQTFADAAAIAAPRAGDWLLGTYIQALDRVVQLEAQRARATLHAKPGNQPSGQHAPIASIGQPDSLHGLAQEQEAYLQAGNSRLAILNDELRQIDTALATPGTDTGKLSRRRGTLQQWVVNVTTRMDLLKAERANLLGSSAAAQSVRGDSDDAADAHEREPELAQLRREKQDWLERVQRLDTQLRVFGEHGLPPQELLFRRFLKEVKRLAAPDFIATQAFIPNTPRPTCFISYAWEDTTTPEGESVNRQLQGDLLRLQRYLGKLGFTVLLDLTDLHGYAKGYMDNEIRQCRYVLLIGTPRLKRRIATAPASGVAYEFAAIKTKLEQEPNCLIPLTLEGDYASAFPPEVAEHLVLDFTARDAWPMTMGRPGSTEGNAGLIPRLYSLLGNDRDGLRYKAYASAWQHFITSRDSYRRALDERGADAAAVLP